LVVAQRATDIIDRIADQVSATEYYAVASALMSLLSRSDPNRYSRMDSRSTRPTDPLTSGPGIDAVGHSEVAAIEGHDTHQDQGFAAHGFGESHPWSAEIVEAE
jgi:hypothetical protein